MELWTGSPVGPAPHPSPSPSWEDSRLPVCPSCVSSPSRLWRSRKPCRKPCHPSALTPAASLPLHVSPPEVSGPSHLSRVDRCHRAGCMGRITVFIELLLMGVQRPHVRSGGGVVDKRPLEGIRPPGVSGPMQAQRGGTCTHTCRGAASTCVVFGGTAGCLPPRPDVSPAPRKL